MAIGKYLWKPEAQAKTAFTTPFGLFQFRRMPFGRSQPRSSGWSTNGLQHCANAYLDDIVIYSGTWQDHLAIVLDRIRAAGLTVKPKKCQFGTNQCVYLGFVVGNGTVQLEHPKIDAIENFEKPKTYLGMTGYYRKFIPDYSTVACSLTDLTRGKAPSQVKWTAD